MGDLSAFHIAEEGEIFSSLAFASVSDEDYPFRNISQLDIHPFLHSSLHVSHFKSAFSRQLSIVRAQCASQAVPRCNR